MFTNFLLWTYLFHFIAQVGFTCSLSDGLAKILNEDVIMEKKYNTSATLGRFKVHRVDVELQENQFLAL